MVENRELIILNSLLQNKEFKSIAMPHLEDEYFGAEEIWKACFKVMQAYNANYECMPNKASLSIELLDYKEWSGEQRTSISQLLDILFDPAFNSNPSLEWLIETTERFCKDKKAYQVIMKTIDIYNGSETKIPESAIPGLMQEVVNISFSTSVGHDWLADAEERFKFYHNPESCIPFDIETLNSITGGRGVARKSLNVIMAGVNCGKTGLMCHLASSYAKQGYNVLYITLEMREELISKRIDANLFDVRLGDIDKLDYNQFMHKINQIKEKSYGKIIVKEFPPGTAHAGHFAHLIQDLKTKLNIKPDVILVDYLGICSSQRAGAGVNSYTYLKYVSEELRSLAVKEDAVMWSAVQLNRGGFDSADVDMTDIADSFAIAATADLLLSLMRTEELDEISQVLMKQIKNRYANKTERLRFTLGVDQEKQQYFDVDGNLQQSAQHKNTQTTAKVLGNNAMNKMNKNRFSGIS